MKTTETNEAKTTEAVPEAEVVSSEAVVEETRAEKAEKIVRKHMLVALGTGIVPPVVDIAALSGVQIRMLYMISKTYDQKFKDEWGKTVIGTLIGGYGMAYLATGAVYSLMKFIPGVGQTVASVSQSVIASASTYALGKVFIKHFEAGGTLLNFNAESMREYYYEQYEQGVKLAKNQAETESEKA